MRSFIFIGVLADAGVDFAGFGFSLNFEGFFGRCVELYGG